MEYSVNVAHKMMLVLWIEKLLRVLANKKKLVMLSWGLILKKHPKRAFTRFFFFGYHKNVFGVSQPFIPFCKELWQWHFRRPLFFFWVLFHQHTLKHSKAAVSGTLLCINSSNWGRFHKSLTLVLCRNVNKVRYLIGWNLVSL